MILADKIIDLRKKAGLSQEELARQIGVSRQSVSKWEGAQSTPDMNKILALSELFGVSTDYLLKDEIESPEVAPASETSGQSLNDDDEPLRQVDMQEANAFLENNERNASLIALGVMLCIFSPIVLVLLTTAAEVGRLAISEDQAANAGIAILVALVAIAVAIFVTRGTKSQRFDYLKSEALDTAYGVDGMAKERRSRYESAHTRDMTIGILLCVIACVPLLVLGVLAGGDASIGSDWAGAVGVAALLFLVGTGVFLIVRTATIWGGFQVILEEGDYTRAAKRVNRKLGGVYWGIVTAAYLLVSFLTMAWGATWVIWPVAGVLYGVISQLYKSRVNH